MRDATPTFLPSPIPPPWRRHPKLIVRILAVLAGLLYGLAMRGLFLHNNRNLLLSQAFLYGVPFGLGFLEVYVSEIPGRLPWIQRFSMPAIPLAISLVVAFLLHWEGAICLVMAAPLLFLAAAVGGLIAGVVRDSFRSAGPRQLVFACSLILPIALTPLEQQIAPPREIHTVLTSLVIDATPETVWTQIKSVPLIRADEQHPGWTQRLGFPRPLAATLSHEGVGGIRRATFEGGVLFLETVSRWEPAQTLAFTIKADTAAIPPTTLDEHVTIGGPYFDVLDGEYEIQPLKAKQVLLHLTSHQRLSTRFNTYAGLWTDAIMRDLQHNILLVIKDRCEPKISE